MPSRAAFVRAGARALAGLPRGVERPDVSRPAGQDAPAQAIARLEPEIAKRPTNAPLLALLARRTARRATRPRRSRRFVARCRSIPALLPGYTMLAQLYMQQRRIDEARAEFEGIVQRDPSAVGARTMVGMLLEAQGRRDEATKVVRSHGEPPRERSGRGQQPRVHLRRAGHESRRGPPTRDVGQAAASRRSQRGRHDRVDLLQEGPAIAGRQAARRQPQEAAGRLPKCCTTSG